MNGERRRTTTPKFTKREPKDGMTRESRSSHPETRYYFLIPGLSYPGMENYEASGKDHSRQ
jgi:hypothetical protein